MHKLGNEIITNNISAFFAKTCEEIDPCKLEECLGISKNTILNAINKKGVSPIEIMSAGHKGNFSFETFLYRKPDSKCLINTILGKKEIIPEKYQQGAFSTRIVSRNILYAIKHLCGEHFTYDLLLTMQTSPDTFSDKNLHKVISPEFNSDLLAILKKEKKDISLGNIGILAGLQYSKSILSKNLRKLSSKDVFIKLGEEVFKHIEKSYHYKLTDVTNNFAVFEKRLTQRVKDNLNVNKYSNKELCSYVVEAMSVLPILGGNRKARGRETRCQFDGDSNYCQYVFEY